MLNAFIGFNKSLLRMPFAWLVWLMALVAANMIAPLFFIEHLEGQVVLGVFVISAGLMVLLYASRGFTRILGAGHSPWIALLPWLWTRHDLIQPDEWLIRPSAAPLDLTGNELLTGPRLAGYEDR